ncbi:PadR family transcriptional regulator [Pelagibacterium halotolerans]|uniref:Transcriptional regulator, PadR family n=1 Tax=Pelagibacterium halotolerans (strain DSM 22347 / JCM 15775 / CGMCC 1.7692 / B2) TaxID=1082931 RepID=G4RCH6_PELHB|nr:PadR family transcriptional regulator [Pelagibacterium halotolerans]AEQ50648.1 transcriptional regulator, PadR family [Pelagibacterium halotolerans B2]QJR19417.1 PadR family transcriptional regulator [Pelagibacterium halotolerans]SDZ92018.1 Transcriptional regulator PadR-like family protein [Pelagibacterium halotolerans]
MSATRLLVLAFVRAHKRAHGYRVGQELMAWNADKWANTKTGSIYHALRQLAKEGLLEEIDVPASETTPGRTDYSITGEGDAEFYRMMEQALTVPQPRPDMLCAGLVLMSALPRQSVLALLRTRLATLAAQKSEVDQATSNASFSGADALPPHVEALLSFWTHNTECNHDWIAGLIVKIEAGAYVFADDDPMAFGTPGGTLVIP